jgi:hypothetical protein
MRKRLHFPLVLILGVAVLLMVTALPLGFVQPVQAFFTATHATGYVEIIGHVYGVPFCNDGCDSGTISVTVNGTTKSVSYDSSSDPQSIASAIASAFNGDSGAPVTATTAQGSNNPSWGGTDWLVQFTTKGTGSGVNYEVDTSVSSVTFGNVLYGDPSCCNPSQTLEVTLQAPYGGTAGTQDLYNFLTGGHN